MKKILYIVVLVFFACNSEDASDCFQNRGETVQQEFEVSAFDKILVNRNIQLIVREGNLPEVLVETGAYLLNDVEVKVVSGQLRLTDNNTCNFVRDYEATKVFVTVPNLTEIRSSTQFEVQSNGVLEFPELHLISEDFNAPGSYTVGDFRLQVNVDKLRIVSNNLSSYCINGAVNELFVGFYAGAGRFEGGNLVAQNVEVYHRGSNDMIVNPQQELTGELRGTGNLISVNQPPVVEVERFYTGELLFE